MAERDSGLPDGAASSAPKEENADALFAQVYERLKSMAGKRISGYQQETLGTTGLVHELYMRMRSGRELAFSHPAKFFAYAARAMRHLLADRARGRLRQKAGGEWMRITLTGADHELVLDSAEKVLALECAIGKLEDVDPRAARVVELVYFAGLSHPEAAQTLEVTSRTIDRDWRFARAFLNSELAP